MQIVLGELAKVWERKRKECGNCVLAEDCVRVVG